MKNFCVSFSLQDSEYMTALRLAVGAVCAIADVDVDAAEDMKVCVTESCLVLKNCGFEGVNVALDISNGVKATIAGEGGKPSDSDNEFSLALVSALVTDLGIERQGGAICKLVLSL